MSLAETTTSTPNDSGQEVELITQSPLEDTDNILSTSIEFDTDSRKRKEITASEDTNEPQNVTPTLTIEESESSSRKMGKIKKSKSGKHYDS